MLLDLCDKVFNISAMYINSSMAKYYELQSYAYIQNKIFPSFTEFNFC